MPLPGTVFPKASLSIKIGSWSERDNTQLQLHIFFYNCSFAQKVKRLNSHVKIATHIYCNCPCLVATVQAGTVCVWDAETHYWALCCWCTAACAKNIEECLLYICCFSRNLGFFFRCENFFCPLYNSQHVCQKRVAVAALLHKQTTHWCFSHCINHVKSFSFGRKS